MLSYNKKEVSNFLAYTVWPNSNYIDITDLNDIQLQDNSQLNLENFKQEVLLVLREQVLSYSVKDGEDIALLLSGWLDSTLLLMLIQEAYPNSEVYTYTLWYTQNDPHLIIAKNIAEKYGCIHKQVIHTLEDSLLETFDDVYAARYELEWEDSLIMNHILAKHIKQDCKYVFSGFGLDYLFAWMDLFKNSCMEDAYNKGMIDKAYILKHLSGNKFYFKYVLNKISMYPQSFFPKYGEYYGKILTSDLEQGTLDYFKNSMNSIRWDISELKKQLYFIISTSLGNRYRPYNVPYEKKGLTHCNPFGSKETIQAIISLNISDEFLLNPYTLEKKFIIRDIFRDMTGKDFINTLHTGTVLKYNNAIDYARREILELFTENKDFLLEYISSDYYNVLDQIVEDSIWYENSKQVIILLQLLFYKKNNIEISSNIQTLENKMECIAQ